MSDITRPLPPLPKPEIGSYWRSKFEPDGVRQCRVRMYIEDAERGGTLVVYATRSGDLRAFPLAKWSIMMRRVD